MTSRQNLITVLALSGLITTISQAAGNYDGQEVFTKNKVMGGVWKSVNEITAVSKFLKSAQGNESIVEKIAPYILSLDGGVRSTTGNFRGTGLILIPESHARVALVVTARHIHGIDYPDKEGPFPEFLSTPDLDNSMKENARLSLDYGETVVSAGTAKRFYSPVFTEPFEGHLKIPPQEDFVLSTIPTKELNASGFKSTQPVARSEAEIGENIFFVGFPGHKKYKGQMQFGTGKVLENGQVKTNVPYDMNVEFIVEVNGFIQNLDEFFGFSGGPVFNQDGAYLGTIVRANQNGSGTTYLRVVRGSYIFNSVQNAIKSLPKDDWQSHMDVLTFPK